MSDNDHEHRAYQVWDGDNRWAGKDEVRQLHYRITELALMLDRLEDAFGELHSRFHDHEQAVPHAPSSA